MMDSRITLDDLRKIVADAKTDYENWPQWMKDACVWKCAYYDGDNSPTASPHTAATLPDTAAE